MSTADKDAVLAANLAFYEAFTTQDEAAMERLWARRAPVTCTHPGWSPSPAARPSWRAGAAPHIMCHDDDAFLHGLVAIVLCEEELTAGSLSAANVFVKKDDEWRLVQHQASPLVARSATRGA